MQYLKIVLLCTVVSIVYGIVHDLVTVHLCLEYFTIGHPPILGGTQNRIALAFGWGIIATWWVGVLLGIPGAILARIGRKPKLSAGDLFKPLAVLMIAMSAIATWAAVFGWVFGGPFAETHFPGKWQSRTPCVMATLMHQTSYAVGFLGGVLMWGWIWWRRWQLALRP